MVMDDAGVFENCLQRGKLLREEPNNDRIVHALAKALDEFIHGLEDYRNGYWERVTTHAYFSMLHATRAAIFSRGVRDTNFFSLLAALKHLFAGDVLTEEELELFRLVKDAKEVIERGARIAQRDSSLYLATAHSMLYKAVTTVGHADFPPSIVPNYDRDA